MLAREDRPEFVVSIVRQCALAGLFLLRGKGPNGMPTDHSIDLKKGPQTLNAARRSAGPKSDGMFDRAVYLLERFGLPTGLLMLAAYVSGKAVVWGGDNIAIPITKRHIAFVDEAEKDRKQTQVLITEISQKLGELANQQRLTNQIIRKVVREEVAP